MQNCGPDYLGRSFAHCSTWSAFSGVFTFGAKVLKDDLKESISDSIKPLAADVAAMKNDLAAVQEIRTDVASLKTSMAFLSNNVAALDVLLVALLGIALYLNLRLLFGRGQSE